MEPIEPIEPMEPTMDPMEPAMEPMMEEEDPQGGFRGGCQWGYLQPHANQHMHISSASARSCEVAKTEGSREGQTAGGEAETDITEPCNKVKESAHQQQGKSAT